VYAEFAAMGLHYGPAHRAITAIDQGDRQLLAHLSLPAVFAADESNGSHSGYVLHPSVMTGAVQAGIGLIADRVRDREAPVLPQRLKRLRVLSPCTETMFAWARHAQDGALENEAGLDIDLIDAGGRLCVQMRGLSFQAADADIESGADATCLSGTQQPADEGSAVSTDSMRVAEKIELYLSQELALLLRLPIESVPVDQNYFDLGLTSLAIAHLVEKISRLLEEDLSPSALLEYSDIRGLASYLAATYPATIEALAVASRNGSEARSTKQRRTQPARLTRLPRKRMLSVRSAQEQTTAAPSHTDVSPEQIVAKVRWQEESPEEAYDTMTF
jgi:hypothetical protein